MHRAASITRRALLSFLFFCLVKIAVHSRLARLVWSPSSVYTSFQSARYNDLADKYILANFISATKESKCFVIVVKFTFIHLL